MRALMVVTGLLWVTAVAGQAQERSVVEVISTRLYLPDSVMRDRVGDVRPFAQYVQSLQQEAAALLNGASRPEAQGLLVAVGVKPGRKARVWCESVDGAIAAKTLAALERKLGEVPPPAVTGGPIGFALELGLWGRHPQSFPEVPSLWAEAVRKSHQPLTIPDEVFKVIWPK